MFRNVRLLTPIAVVSMGLIPGILATATADPNLQLKSVVTCKVKRVLDRSVFKEALNEQNFSEISIQSDDLLGVATARVGAYRFYSQKGDVIRPTPFATFDSIVYEIIPRKTQSMITVSWNSPDRDDELFVGKSDPTSESKRVALLECR